MIEIDVLKKLSEKSAFNSQDFYEVYHINGNSMSNETLRKKLQIFLKKGSIVRVGRGLYSVKEKNKLHYEYQYSEMSQNIASVIKENHPYLSFSIFEVVQLNEFINHQLAHNIIFLAVEDDVMNFVFDTLREHYPGKVLLCPTVEMFHQYWSEDMIVIGKLITEAPKGSKEIWHTPLEKMLVDLFAENLILESVSRSEYHRIFEGAFHKYVIDESRLFRYAKRRNAHDKIKKLICEETDIVLKIKE